MSLDTIKIRKGNPTNATNRLKFFLLQLKDRMMETSCCPGEGPWALATHNSYLGVRYNKKCSDEPFFQINVVHEGQVLATINQRGDCQYFFLFIRQCRTSLWPDARCVCHSLSRSFAKAESFDAKWWNNAWSWLIRSCGWNGDFRLILFCFVDTFQLFRTIKGVLSNLIN